MPMFVQNTNGVKVPILTYFEDRGLKIQQMYENLELDLHLKLLFMVTGASGV